MGGIGIIKERSKDIMGHTEFLASQEARKRRGLKKRRQLQRHRFSCRVTCGIDFFLCTFFTVFFFIAYKPLGVSAFILMWMPVYFDMTRNVLMRPPWTTVKGEPDCPVCYGKYFLSNGIWTYWIGWKECDCQSTRVFRRRT